jgi:NADH dehydrogenase
VLLALHRAGVGDVRCLTRRPDALDPSLPWNAGWRRVAGDLHDPAQYTAAVPSGGVIVHLAGTVGKHRHAEFQRGNVDATRCLLSAARDAGAGHFVQVSSIAATYPDDARSPYGWSKREAERSVSSSGLSWTILRPTMVFGAGSANFAALARLASLPIPCVFGSGRVEVQPIDVDDVAAIIADAAVERWPDETVEAGGPDRVTMETLLRSIRASRGHAPRPFVHLPLDLARSALSIAEPLLFPLLPFTAGQLAAFAYPSCARPSARMSARHAALKPLAAMVSGG